MFYRTAYVPDGVSAFTALSGEQPLSATHTINPAIDFAQCNMTSAHRQMRGTIRINCVRHVGLGGRGAESALRKYDKFMLMVTQSCQPGNRKRIKSVKLYMHNLLEVRLR